MDPTAMSFEARIGLALKGSNWQEIQNLGKVASSIEGGVVQETVDSQLAEGGVEAPKVLTAKQKQKMERFGQTVARDAGHVLQVIEADALTPIPGSVTWDKDPELLCCYNWQASTDGTNTIFGELKFLESYKQALN